MGPFMRQGPVSQRTHQPLAPGKAMPERCLQFSQRSFRMQFDRVLLCLLHLGGRLREERFPGLSCNLPT
jgi:hypothetical protein